MCRRGLRKWNSLRRGGDLQSMINVRACVYVRFHLLYDTNDKPDGLYSSAIQQRSRELH